MTDINEPVLPKTDDQENKPIPAMQTKRVGMVRISLITNTMEQILELLDGCIIFDTNRNLLNNETEYMISHPDLDEVEFGIKPPEYRILITENEDGTKTRTFERSSGRFFLAGHPSSKALGTTLYLIPVEFADDWSEFCDLYLDDDPIWVPAYAKACPKGSLTFTDPQFVKFKDEN